MVQEPANRLVQHGAWEWESAPWHFAISGLLETAIQRNARDARIAGAGAGACCCFQLPLPLLHCGSGA